MRVTRFQYPLDENLLEKINLMIERCTDKRTKRDAVLICEGAEGEGKTTFSIAIAYYVSEKTSRSFGEANVFFDLQKLIEFAQSTENQIIIWDEPALQALSKDWASSIVRDMDRLLMMARKKRHFFIFNMSKFYRFGEYAAVERPVGMIHCYSRKNIYAGRYVYIRKKNLEPLYYDCKFRKKKTYKKWSSKRIRGTFPDVLSPEYKYNVLSEFDIETYEKNKDKAIMSIGKNDKGEIKNQADDMKARIAFMPGLTIKEIARLAGVSTRAIDQWRKKFRNDRVVLTPYTRANAYSTLGQEGTQEPEEGEEDESID